MIGRIKVLLGTWVGIGTICTAAFGSNLNLNLTSAGLNEVTVEAGATVDYVVTGQLSDVNNEGLAAFAFDLTFDGGDLAPANPPDAAPMTQFIIPAGLTNPEGYAGTVIAGRLVQIGGTQNLVKNKAAAFPIGSVTPGVAQAAQVLVTGSLTAPMQNGVFTLSISDVLATVIQQDDTGIGPFWVSELAGAGTISNLTITVLCVASSQPEPHLILNPGVALVKSRFLSFRGGDIGRIQAVRVTFDSLRAPFDIWNGSVLYVGQPFKWSELSSKGFGIVPALGEDTYLAAELQCAPFFMDWRGVCTEGSCVGGPSEGNTCADDDDCIPVIHMHHKGIVPSKLQAGGGGIDAPARYSVQLVDSSCSLDDEASFSDALTITNAGWSDVGGPFDGGADLFTPPDLSVDVPFDCISLLDKFVNEPGAPITARADLEPFQLDGVINILEIVLCIDAFGGIPFPFNPDVPILCP